MANKTINIRKAERSGARLVLGIAGISGSGKTYTALQLAYGLANYDANKVGFLDTENGRGRLYSEILRDGNNAVQQFWHADLDAPFSPQRYIDSILAFQEAGVEVLVIDSVTHEWEGIGGCHEIASPPGTSLKIKKWNDAKAEHKRFMNTLLASNMHVIACIRARRKVELRKSPEGKTDYIELGVLPVQEDNFMFEMTASMMMWNEGKSQESLKCPEALRNILARGNDYITAADGKALRQWVDGAAEQLDPDVEAARNTLRTSAERGRDAVAEQWAKTPKRVQRILKEDGTLAALQSSAEAYDRARERAAAGGDDELADLNREMQEA